MPSDVVYNLFRNIDEATTAFISTVGGGLAAYVMPLVWIALAIWVVCYSWLVMAGKVSTPTSDLAMKALTSVIVLTIMTTKFNAWVVQPAINLPQELIIAAGAGKDGGAMGVLSSLVSQTKEMFAAYISIAMSEGLKGNMINVILVLGSMLIVVLILIILIACSLFILIYAKIGLAIVLAVGPIFLSFLLVPQIKSWFFSWLNTAWYFILLALLGSLCVQFFVNIVTIYITKVLAVYGTSTGLVDSFLQFFSNMSNLATATVEIVLITIPLIFLMLQLPTIASSLSQGSGGAAAGGGSSLFHMARSVMSGGAGAAAGSAAAGSAGGAAGAAPKPSASK
jgi:type IV secretion system protein VirB6